MTNEYFEIVLERERELLYRIAYAILGNETDAEDAISESVLKAWEKRHQLNEAERLGGWLVKILTNVAKQKWTKRSREYPMEDMENFIEDKEQGAAQEGPDIWGAVGSLKENQKTVVVLFYYKEYKISEISKIMEIPIGTVKYLLHEARVQLRNILLDTEGMGNE